MPLPSDLQRDADATISSVVERLDEAQRLYHETFARYWQGAKTHISAPSDGAASPVDRTSRISGYESWQELNIELPGTSVVMFSVSVYNSPLGLGYILYAFVRSDGVLYRRSINTGIQRGFQRGWHALQTVNLSARGGERSNGR